MLSNTGKYALRAVIYLALHVKDNNKIGINKISDDLNVPTPFLGKILQTLVKHKLLSSAKGPNGGFGLNKALKSITLLDIVEIIDGKDFFTSCLLSSRECHSEQKHCPLHNEYAHIRSQLYDMFKNKRLDILVKEIKASNKNIIL